MTLSSALAAMLACSGQQIAGSAAEADASIVLGGAAADAGVASDGAGVAADGAGGSDAGIVTAGSCEETGAGDCNDYSANSDVLSLLEQECQTANGRWSAKPISRMPSSTARCTYSRGSPSAWRHMLVWMW
jgi:hypothetical protein